MPVYPALSLIDYPDSPYATWIAEGKKTIETRTRRLLHHDRLLIVASQKSRPQTRGKALCLVQVIGCRKMRPEDEKAAMAPYHPNLYSIILDYVIRFHPFSIKGMYTGGSRQWVYYLDVPADYLNAME